VVFLQITALLVLSILLFRLTTCLFFITKNARELYAQTPYPYATPCPVFLLSSAPRKKKTPLRFCMHMCQNAYMHNAKRPNGQKEMRWLCLSIHGQNSVQNNQPKLPSHVINSSSCANGVRNAPRSNSQYQAPCRASPRTPAFPPPSPSVRSPP